MQFFIREGELHAHVVMRSQNALMVLPYDFYFFSLFHEALSVRLAVDLGKIYYTANSLHIYEDFIELTHSINADGVNEEYLVMKDFSDHTIKKLRTVFNKIVVAQTGGRSAYIPDIIHNYEMDDYWRKLLLRHFAS
jgi:thymidylate synthase